MHARLRSARRRKYAHTITRVHTARRTASFTAAKWVIILMIPVCALCVSVRVLTKHHGRVLVCCAAMLSMHHCPVDFDHIVSPRPPADPIARGQCHSSLDHRNRRPERPHRAQCTCTWCQDRCQTHLESPRAGSSDVEQAHGIRQTCHGLGYPPTLLLCIVVVVVVATVVVVIIKTVHGFKPRQTQPGWRCRGNDQSQIRQKGEIKQALKGTVLNKR